MVVCYLQEGSPFDSFDVILQQTNFNDSYSFRTQKVEKQKTYLLVGDFFSLSRRIFVIHTVGTHAGARVLINSIRQR